MYKLYRLLKYVNEVESPLLVQQHLVVTMLSFRGLNRWSTRRFTFKRILIAVIIMFGTAIFSVSNRAPYTRLLKGQ